MRVGEPVAAIGSPFGEQGSLSIGVVSAKNRTIEALTDFSISDAIQTDAAVNRGNSGGPLLDARGRVIGINSQIRSSGGGSVGVGFAISVDNVRRSIDQIREGGEASYAYIGISSQNLYPQLAERLDVPVEDGALIADVVENGPADKAGIKGGGKEIRFQASLVKLGGDVITKVNGRRVTRENDFSEQITRFSPGDTISLELYRGNERRTARVTLGERPDQVPRASRMQELLVELARGLRAHVQPFLGSHAHREHVQAGAGGDVTFAIDEEAEAWVEQFLAERAPDVAFYSEDRGLVTPAAGDPETVLVIDPDRRHAAGDGRPRVLLRLGRRGAARRRQPDDGRRDAACVAEIKTDGCSWPSEAGLEIRTANGDGARRT